MSQRKNNAIYFTPDPMPEVVRLYVKIVVRDAPYGMDGLFGHPYMEEKLNSWVWEDHGLPKPDIYTFCRWAMSVRKEGLGYNGKRKPAFKMPWSIELKKEIIEKVKSYTGSSISESFLGSPKHKEIADLFARSHGIRLDHFTQILQSDRKRTKSQNLNKLQIYAYKPAPKSRPNDVKLGITKDVTKRMDQETKNTRSEQPELIGWFWGTKKDEGPWIKENESYKVKGLGNKEMFKFDMKAYKELRVRLEEKIEMHDGKMGA